jgi:hypothetical protein
MPTKGSQQFAASEDACYLTEDSLAQDLTAIVSSHESPVRCSETASEFDYSSGRADLVGRDSRDCIHAFEAKLSRWRDALEQARRNTCFAHYCYVAIPSRAAAPALKAREQFHRYGVGLVLLTGQSAKLAIRPRRNNPLLPWLTKLARAFVSRA